MHGVRRRRLAAPCLTEPAGLTLKAHRCLTCALLVCRAPNSLAIGHLTWWGPSTRVRPWVGGWGSREWELRICNLNGQKFHPRSATERSQRAARSPLYDPFVPPSCPGQRAPLLACHLGLPPACRPKLYSRVHPSDARQAISSSQVRPDSTEGLGGATALTSVRAHGRFKAGKPRRPLLRVAIQLN